MHPVACTRVSLPFTSSSVLRSFLSWASSWVISKRRSTLSSVHQRMQAVWMVTGRTYLVLPRNARIQKQLYPHGICHQRCRESKRVGCGVNCSQNCFRGTSKVFFRSRVSQQLPEDTTHPKLGVGTKLNNQLISVWLPEPP